MTKGIRLDVYEASFLYSALYSAIREKERFAQECIPLSYEWEVACSETHKCKLLQNKIKDMLTVLGE